MKSIEEFVELFTDQFDDIESGSVTPETIFHDMDEWTSLIALSVIAMIDEEFDVVVNGEEMRSSVTVQDLYDIVISKLD